MIDPIISTRTRTQVHLALMTAVTTERWAEAGMMVCLPIQQFIASQLVTDESIDDHQVG
eukprot:COSAG01_NODE_34564_length_545_cov_1.354260_1_plen_58_part_10